VPRAQSTGPVWPRVTHHELPARIREAYDAFTAALSRGDVGVG
jgi:hypothetical protein